MCRFVLYLGAPLALDLLITKPANSLIHQSFHAEMRQPLNGDGFGIAWYPHGAKFGPEPAIFRAVTPAWNNLNLFNLARVTQSECILAHVRAASPGMPVTESNCHPFVYGPFSFMHNGGVARFHRIKRSLISRLSDEAYHSVVGSTDSAHLFALFLDEWATSKQQDPLLRISEALQMTVEITIGLLREHGITEESQLNLAVADGRHAVACRFTTGDVKHATTLYWHEGKRYVCRKGVVYMVDPVTDTEALDAPGDRTDTVIIASEPLSDDFGWEVVAPNSMVLIGNDRRVRLQEMPKWSLPGDSDSTRLDDAVGTFYHISGHDPWGSSPGVPTAAVPTANTLTHYPSLLEAGPAEESPPAIRRAHRAAPDHAPNRHHNREKGRETADEPTPNKVVPKE